MIRDVFDDWEDHPARRGLRNFTWTHEAIADWEAVWHHLWHLGFKWEWQNADRYARRRGDTYDIFACYNDAVRLDMAVPLPGVVLMEEIKEILLDDPTDDPRVTYAINDIELWLRTHYNG